MPSTPRKPAGAAKGYIVATSWLHAETAFQKKLLLIKGAGVVIGPDTDDGDTDDSQNGDRR